MRQPTNLRGATLPGLSQPSEKEGPHHRSLSACQKLQWRADSPLQSHPFSLLFFLPGSGEAKFKLRSSDDWATPVTLSEEERRQASSQVSQTICDFLYSACAQLPSLPGVGVARLIVGAVWLLSQKPDIWTAQAI